MNSLVRAAIAAAFIVSAAAPVMAEREMVSVRVSRAGLDLGRPSDRARMKLRVRRAAEVVCGQVTASLESYAEVRRCRREMGESADAAIARLAGSRAAVTASAN